MIAGKKWMWLPLPLLMGLLVSCSDAPDPDAAPLAKRQVPSGFIPEGAAWKVLVDGLIFVSGITGDADGNVYFAESYLNRVYKVDREQNVALLDENSAMTVDVKIGPDGLLYACRNLDAQIIRYNPSGEREVLLQGKLTPVPQPDKPGEFCNDIEFNGNEGIWFSDRVNRKVIYLASDGSARAVAGGFRPNGIALSIDGKILAVTDSESPRLHAFEVGANGQLTEVKNYFDPIKMPTAIGDKPPVSTDKPGTNSIAVDTEGRFYVATLYGIQIFDRDGDYLGVLDIPGSTLFYNSSLAFGGEDKRFLYAGGRNGIERVQLLVQGY